MAASQSVLEILIQAVDESAGALQGAENNLKSVGQEAISAGLQIGIAGAALTGAYVAVVDSAANVQESQDALKQAVTDAMAGASTSTEAYGTQVEFLKAKIEGYKATQAVLTAEMDKLNTSTAKGAAEHAKYSAGIQSAQINAAKYQQQLDQLQNSQKLGGEAIDEVTSKLDNQAVANVSLGFSIADSTHSLSQAFTATKSMSEALQVNQAAMDLARAKQIDLGTATNQVILAMNGQGRALAAYGIQIKDGLSGMEALQAVQGAVGGQAQAFADTLTGQLAVAMQSFNKLLSDMGTTQLPILTQLLQLVVKIITAIDSFITQHQKLTETILIFVAVLGGLLTLLGTFLIILGTLFVIVALLTLPLTLLIGLIALLASVIIANWGSLRDDMIAIWQIISGAFTKLWNDIKNATSAALNWIAAFINESLTGIQNVWDAIWSAVASFFTGIWSGIKTGVQDAINFVKSVVQGFVSWALGILAPILGPINSIGSAASSFGKTIGSAIGAAASVLNIHDAIITPGGQVIQSDPADFLIATKTPGSLVGGGGGSSINVYIQGGYYMDQNAATQIGDMIAKKINQQIRLQNYRS